MNHVEPQKVLIADDDPINRQVLAALLKPEYTVLLAKNGEQALERAARHAPDLILLDVMMPDLDGYEVLRRLRADPQLEQIAVIFISGLARPEDEAIGLKLGASDYITKPFNATVVMARVALHLQLVRQRRMLERLAHVDGLTELANRRRFDEMYAQEWQRAQRNGWPLSLALLDIDAFKQYNDYYGHPAGDRALQFIARAIRGSVRVYDFCARQGGDEFIVVLQDCDAKQARERAVELQDAVSGIPFEPAPGVAVTLSISVGHAMYPSDGGSFESLIRCADERMYRDKSERKRSGVPGLPVPAPVER